MSITTIGEKVAFIESVFGAGRLAHNQKNIEVRCPICAPANPNKKKLAIKVDNWMNHCWTCGWKAHTLAPLLKKHARREKLIEYRNRFMTNYEKSFLNSNEEEQKEPLLLPKDFRLLAIRTKDPDTNAIYNYVTARGITQSDMWYYMLGYSDELRWKHRVIVPSFDVNGKLNYFVARAISKYQKPKYDNPDYDKRPIIFNEMNVDWTKRLVLCEGAFDMFKCGTNVVPMLGSDLSEQSALFNMILVHGTPIALALDADMWNTKTIKIAKKLQEYDIDVIVVDTRPFIDPGQATKEQFSEALKNAMPLDWISVFHTKLSLASNIKL